MDEHDDAIEFLKKAIDEADQARACLPRGSTQRGDISAAINNLLNALRDCEIEKKEWANQ